MLKVNSDINRVKSLGNLFKRILLKVSHKAPPLTSNKKREVLEVIFRYKIGKKSRRNLSDFQNIKLEKVG